PFASLGTDGFGLSDTRPAVRRHFNVDAESITVAALATLASRGEFDRAAVAEAAAKYRIDDPQAAGPKTSERGLAREHASSGEACFPPFRGAVRGSELRICRKITGH